jgi:hypothetical protein
MPYDRAISAIPGRRGILRGIAVALASLGTAGAELPSRILFRGFEKALGALVTDSDRSWTGDATRFVWQLNAQQLRSAKFNATCQTCRLGLHWSSEMPINA